MKALFAALWVVGGLASGACGSSGGGGAPDADVGGIECTPGGTFDLNGRAGVLGLLNVHINASGLVETDTTSELLLIMDAVHDGTDVAVIASLCAIEIPDVPIAGQDQPIQFDVPDETVQSVAGVMGDGVLSSANENCATFTTETFTIVLGARLNPIETAELPSADDNGNFPSCAPTPDTECELAIGVNCACDQESDGKPGATLRAANVPVVDLDEVYVTLRTQFSLDGIVIDSDNIVGLVDATLEQSILGCHAAAGSQCSPDQIGSVQQLNPEITQQGGNPSSFRAVRIADTMTCAELVANKNELFPL